MITNLPHAELAPDTVIRTEFATQSSAQRRRRGRKEKKRKEKEKKEKRRKRHQPE